MRRRRRTRASRSSESACCASRPNGPCVNGSGSCVAPGRDELDQLGLEPVEDRAHLRRLHAGLEVVQEDVVRVVRRWEAVEVALLELEDAVEPRTEGGVVGCGAGRDPDVMRLRGDVSDLRGELGRDARRLVPVAARDADQARVQVVVGQRFLERAQLLEQAADLVAREELVLQRLERRQVIGARLRRRPAASSPGDPTPAPPGRSGGRRPVRAGA